MCITAIHLVLGDEVKDVHNSQLMQGSQKLQGLRIICGSLFGGTGERRNTSRPGGKMEQPY